MNEMNLAEKSLIYVGKFTVGVVATAVVGATLGASCVFGVHSATRFLERNEKETPADTRGDKVPSTFADEPAEPSTFAEEPQQYRTIRPATYTTSYEK